MKSRTLMLAGVAALLPVTAGAGAPSGGAAHFVPPAEPMVLTRTVWRNLFDGNQIKVVRSYAVQIEPSGDGFTVAGHLIDAQVDAPAPLAMLADYERHRPDEGVFPLRLDQNGQILQSPPAEVPAAMASELTNRGAAMIDGAGVSSAAKQRTRALLNQVIAAARGGVNWPSDLFNPASSAREQRREVALPDGGRGEVVVSVTFDRPEPGAVPRTVERTVKTLLQGTESVSREQWTIAPR